MSGATAQCGSRIAAVSSLFIPELTGRHQLRILPEHGPGAVARNARLRGSTLAGNHPPAALAALEVEVRDLATYETVFTPGGER